MSRRCHLYSLLEKSADVCNLSRALRSVRITRSLCSRYDSSNSSAHTTGRLSLWAVPNLCLALVGLCNQWPIGLTVPLSGSCIIKESSWESYALVLTVYWPVARGSAGISWFASLLSTFSSAFFLPKIREGNYAGIFVASYPKGAATFERFGTKRQTKMQKLIKAPSTVWFVWSVSSPTASVVTLNSTSRPGRVKCLR